MGGAWRSQAARSAACSSRMTLGDRAGVPLVMSAPCSHRRAGEHARKRRGGDAGVAAVWASDSGQHALTLYLELLGAYSGWWGGLPASPAPTQPSAYWQSPCRRLRWRSAAVVARSCGLSARVHRGD